MQQTPLNPRINGIVKAYEKGSITPRTARCMLDDIGSRCKPLAEDIERAKVGINRHETFKMMHEDRQQPDGQKKMASMIEMHGELSP